jgi:hypothetical protein
MIVAKYEVRRRRKITISLGWSEAVSEAEPQE